MARKSEADQTHTETINTYWGWPRALFNICSVSDGMIRMKRSGGIKNAPNLTRRFPTLSNALVPACAKLAHFGLLNAIA